LYDDLSDAELAAECRAGRAAAWSTMVRRFQRLIYTIPRRAGLGDAEAADIFQASFARLHEHIARIDDLSRVRAWLVTTARRETLRRLDELRRFPVSEVSPDHESEDSEDALSRVPDEGPLPEQQLAELQDQARLREAVDRLDPRSRQFVELLFLQEEPLPYSEIATRLGIAEGSIGPTRARVLAKLRQLLR
jgi:RNA polymerase sigma factor (sigma-70 family)